VIVTTEVNVPDIGDFKNADVIELRVNPGDAVSAEDALITLETDSDTLGDRYHYTQSLSPANGEVSSEPDGAGAATKGSSSEFASSTVILETAQSRASFSSSRERLNTRDGDGKCAPSASPGSQPQTEKASFGSAHAGPSVRHLARELGVDLGQVKGSGLKSRILKADVQGYVKSALSRSPPFADAAGPGPFLSPMPTVDFAKFGPIERIALTRIKKLSAANLHRNWMSIPHVTQHDEADITELEQFRKSSQSEANHQGIKLTLLSFLLKASVRTLRQFPDVNSSLEAGAATLVRKSYYHIGVAVDTPDGLVVPVLRDVEAKGVFQLARELREISARARDRKLSPGDMQGGSFSISSLGGIGGTSFTPIINAPEVAILGVSRASIRPVYQSGQFVPRLLLPLSLSYDHRVIDGATAVRFTTLLCAVLADIRRLVL
jgi:pyruvate dehydrogenase E2 component (dihydrolipoamide acetyltransferase)